MSMNVVELFPRGAKPVWQAPLYFMQWTTESGRAQYKSTSDRASVRRQLDSCRQRGLPALVKMGGEICGGVISMTALDGAMTFRATFHDESWGV